MNDINMTDLDNLTNLIHNDNIEILNLTFYDFEDLLTDNNYHFDRLLKLKYYNQLLLTLTEIIEDNNLL